ncbi:MAG: glycoside hydrolase family 28 protein [Nibricoccus sp.]
MLKMPFAIPSALLLAAALLTSVSATLVLPAATTSEQAWADADAIVKRIVVPKFPDKVFNVSDFQAPADGKADARPAIQAAIEACHQAGGGRVLVPAGSYFIDGPIHLRSNVDLHLAKNAVLVFGANAEKYLPLVLTRWEATLCYNYSPLIYARDATNVALTGEGLINGNAKAEFATWRAKQTKAQAELRRMGAEGVPVEDRRFGTGHWLRPGTIQFFECRNVLVEGVTIIDAPFWVVHPVFCKSVTVRGVTVDSHNANNDGCDPDSSVDVLIEDCHFRTGDDAIAIKSGRDQDGWKTARPTENVVIKNLRTFSDRSALCIGSEMSGDVRNVYMVNTTVEQARSAFYFKANLDRGGVVENVWVRDLRALRTTEGVVRFETSYQGYRGGNFPPVFRHFHIENVTCSAADAYAIYIEGVTAAPVHDVTLKNITVTKATAPTWLRLADNLHFDNVVINGEKLPENPPLTPPDVKKLKINN